MAHAIYQTSALILKTKNMRESNKLIVLYTEKFGLIYTSVQSVRELRSKMRFHTNVLSLVEVDLVRGRNIWKVTGIHEKYSAFDFAPTEWYPFLRRISSLVMRLCSGEESHDKLWQDIENMYSYIELNTQNTEYIECIEIVFVSRMLHHLGYATDDALFISNNNPFTSDIFNEIIPLKKQLIQAINEGINSSQL